jgi:hypothetical protein
VEFTKVPAGGHRTMGNIIVLVSYRGSKEGKKEKKERERDSECSGSLVMKGVLPYSKFSPGFQHQML